MNRFLQAILAVSALAFAAHASAQITFYSGHTFRGNAFTLTRPVPDFFSEKLGNRGKDSVYVEGGRWEVCSGPHYTGRCVVLRQGGYPVLRDMGLDDNIASARPVQGGRRHDNEVAVPVQQPEYAYRRRHQERVFEAPVTEVRAVMGPPTQRCWVESQAVQQPNIGGALAGAVVGGILGHQIGGGSGRDLATGAGVVGGAVVGNQIAGGSSQRVENVQRCQTVSGGAPAYWDVTYNFQGRLHTVQMTNPPGNTVTVNGRGEPRG